MFSERYVCLSVCLLQSSNLCQTVDIELTLLRYIFLAFTGPTMLANSRFTNRRNSKHRWTASPSSVAKRGVYRINSNSPVFHCWLIRDWIISRLIIQLRQYWLTVVHYSNSHVRLLSTEQRLAGSDKYKTSQCYLHLSNTELDVATSGSVLALWLLTGVYADAQ